MLYNISWVYRYRYPVACVEEDGLPRLRRPTSPIGSLAPVAGAVSNDYPILTDEIQLAENLWPDSKTIKHNLPKRAMG
jgi:hypothetical protein